MGLRHLFIPLTLLVACQVTALHAQTLVFCSEGSPQGFDPAMHWDQSTFDASSRTTYNRLVEFVPGTTTLQPGLAESWEISPDGLEYTFRLRADVRFHSNNQFRPTRDFGADDVIFSIERQRLQNHPYHEVASDGWRYFAGMSLPDLIASVEKVNDLTVKLVLRRPDASILSTLAMDFASVLSAEYADAMLAAGTPDMLDRAPVGTGPFTFVSYDADQRIRFAANPDYWEGPVSLSELVFEITPSAAQRTERVQSGECHLMADPAPATLDAVTASDDVAVVEGVGLDIGYLAFNTAISPFDNPNVRRALNLAIDRAAVVEEVFGSAGRIAKTPIPPTVWSYREETSDPLHDPAAARALLAEEGIEGLEMKIWAMPIRRPYNPDAARVAGLIRANLAEVGVAVEIVSYPWDEYLSRSRRIDRDGAILFGWTGNNGDPDNFLATLLGCDGVTRWNRAQWCHRPFDDLIQKAKTVSDPLERAALYREAQAIFEEQVPWVPLAHSVSFAVVRNEVEGFVADPLGGHIFKTLSLLE